MTRADHVSVPDAGAYRLDPVLCRLTFRTTHLFGAASVSGSFALSSGTITVAEPVTASSAHATVEVASFSTSSAKRDRQVMSAGWLNAAQHPRIVFAADRAALVEGAWVLSGTLTVCGMPSTVELTVLDAHLDGATLTVHATTRVDRYAFGVTKHKGMAGRYLDLDVRAVAVRT